MSKLTRISELVSFEFTHALTSMKSSVFIIPYFLFWYLIFTNISADALEWVQGAQGLFLASWLLRDQELALQLLVDRSPILSIYMLLSAAIMPLFVVFTANNQLSSDTSSGAFRFVLTRVSRTELFVSRFFSAYLLVASCILLTTCWALVVAYLNEEQSLSTLLVFAAETCVLLLFYGMPFVAFMSLISALTRSAIGCLFLAIMAYSLMVILAFWLKADFSYAAYLVPGSIRPYLYDVSISNILTAIIALFAYTAVYFIGGWQLFCRRDI